MESVINFKFGTSQTLRTFSFVILVKPVNVAYRLFIAYLISPKLLFHYFNLITFASENQSF